MKNTFSRMMVLVMTMWLGFAAGTASAVPTITGWEGDANDAGFSATFGNNAVSSTFSDWISFSLPVGSSGDTSSNVISLGGGGIAFTAFNLYENAVLVATGVLNGSTASLSFSDGTTPGNYSLNVAGFKINPALSASYAGNISVSPIPEPETYAMLLAGLGLIGFSARRRA